MAKVTFVGEPNYELIERGVRMMFAQLTPEQRRKYARKVDSKGDEGDTATSSTKAQMPDAPH